MQVSTVTADGYSGDISELALHMLPLPSEQYLREWLGFWAAKDQSKHNPLSGNISFS